MFRFKVIKLFFIITAELNFAISLRSFDIRWTRSNCSIMAPSLVSFYECPIKELPKNRGNILSGRVRFSHEIKNITLEFIVSMPGGGGKMKYMDVFKFRTDGCKLYKYKTANPVVNAIVKKLIERSDMPRGCPLIANFTYAMENFALNPDYFPGFTPEMNFGTKFNMFLGKTHLLYANVEARIIKKK